MSGDNGRTPISSSNGKSKPEGSNGSSDKAAENVRRPAFARFAHITGWGMAVPERVMTNHEIARLVDTTDEWIVQRTGIKERHIAGEKETTTSLSTLAAQRALEMADVLPETVEMVVVATATPEYSFPATACLVQDAIGAENAAAFDISAACTGFITALGIASDAIRSGRVNTAVVIGAETLSKVTNWQDRGTCILFGDGAGAFVLQGSDNPGGILSYQMHADGSGGDLLNLRSVGSNRPQGVPALLDHTIEMNGREVFRFATRVIAAVLREAVSAAGFGIDDLRIIIPHQANRRIIEAAARSLDMPDDKFFINVDRYGNTSAASIPIATCEAVASGRVRPNDRIAFVGFGGGLTWGAVAVHWDVTPPAEPTRWKQIDRQSRLGLARARSLGRQVWRRMEGVLFGSEAPEGNKPPKRVK